jgi:hypothetical protein
MRPILPFSVTGGTKIRYKPYYKPYAQKKQEYISEPASRGFPSAKPIEGLPLMDGFRTRAVPAL